MVHSQMLPTWARPWKGQASPESLPGMKELGSAGREENPGEDLAEQKALSDWLAVPGPEH